MGIILSILVLCYCVYCCITFCICVIMNRAIGRRNRVPLAHRGVQVQPGPVERATGYEPSAPPLSSNSAHAAGSIVPPSYNPEYDSPHSRHCSEHLTLGQNALTEDDFPPPYPGSVFNWVVCTLTKRISSHSICMLNPTYNCAVIQILYIASSLVNITLPHVYFYSHSLSFLAMHVFEVPFYV